MVAGTSKLSGWSLGGTCNYGGCPHGGEGDGDVNKAQGCIQSASELGLRTGIHVDTVEQLRSISMPLDKNRLERKRVGTLRSQVHQLDGLLMRWHVVAQSSHADPMILEGSHVPKGHGGAFQLGIWL